VNRYLLDTHAFLWWILDDPRLGQNSKRMIADANNEVYVSAASLWEISIKEKLGKLRAPDVVMSDVVVNEGFLPLSISLTHGEIAGALPEHHKDPFDRMLVTQAQKEGLILITKDDVIRQYDVQIVDASE
jgi:PIN domain nuclease of toxin-antitoxin system